MIYLVLMVLLNALIAVIFKLFVRYRVDNLPAIVINYWVCVLTGSIFLGECPVAGESIAQPWFPMALLMGGGFILVFNLFAYCTKTEGITTATVANKLSLIIPVLFSVLLYGETLSPVHLAGIVLAFPAVYLTSAAKDQPERNHTRAHFAWTVLLFAGSGLLDTAMKFAEQKYLADPTSQAVYTIHVFGVAACIGTVILVALLLTGKIKLSRRSLLGGIVLGVPNYFSIYFMVRMLNSNFIKSSAMIPLSNVGVLLASACAALLLFREKFTGKKWFGLALSFLVIILLAMA